MTPAADPLVPENRWDSSIVNTITGLGGLTDKGAVARPNLDRFPLDDTELAALYLENGIARRIVDLVPAEGTRKGWTVTAEGEDSTRVDVPGAAEEDRRLGTVSEVAWSWAMARLWGHAIVLMVTDEDIPPGFRGDDAAWLATPLDLTKVRRLVALQTFDAMEAIPLTYDGNIRSKTYREPLVWSLSPNYPGVVRDVVGRAPSVVHASRCLYFRGRYRPNSLRYAGALMGANQSSDDSVLRAVWDEIRNLSQTMAGGATLAQELRESVLKVSGLRGLQTGDQAAEVTARMRLMAQAKSLLGVLILGENDAYANNANPPTGFRELSTEAQAMLSAVTGIPLTILFGHAPAGLSTDDKSGRQAWDRNVSAEQKRIEPQLAKLYQTMFAAKEGPMRGQEMPQSIRPKFEPLMEESTGEKAETYKKTAEADAVYLDRNVVGPEQIAAARFSPEGWQQDVPPQELAEEETTEAVGEGAAVVDLDEEEGEGAVGGLNGAQAEKAWAAALDARRGLMPRSNAVAFIMHSFNLSREAAEEMVPQPNPDAVESAALPSAESAEAIAGA